MIAIPSFRRTPEIFAPGQLLGPLAGTILVLLTTVVAIPNIEKQLFVLLCLLFSVIVLPNKTIGLALLLPLSFYSLYLRSALSMPALFVNLIYVVLLLLALGWLGELFLKILQKRPIPKTSIDRTVLLLFAVITVSFLLNRPPLGPAVKSVVLHTSFFLLFYTLAHSSIKESILRRLLYAVLVVALIQVLASFVQYFFIFTDMPPGFRHDKSGGLFGWSAGTVNAVFMVYTFSVIVGFIKVYGTRLSHLFLIFLLIVPIVLADAKAGLIFFVLTGVFLLAITPRFRGRLLQRDIAQLQGLVVFLVLVISIIAGRDLRFLTNPEAVINRAYGLGGARLGRLGTVELAHERISRNPVTLIFGQGPGQLTHTRVGAMGGATHSDFMDEFGDEARAQHSFLHITLDLGYGGLILFLFLHYKLFMVSSTVFRGVDDKFWKAIALGFAGIVFTSAYSIVYTQTWIKPALVFPFWLMAGSLYRVGRIKGVFR